MMQCLQYLLTAEKRKKDRQAAINKRERHIERYDNLFIYLFVQANGSTFGRQTDTYG